jgi:hypothetical protein
VPATASVFALPDRLAAKRDAALIAADERHLRRVAESIDATVAQLRARLDEAQRTRGEERGEVVERDMEVRRLASRIAAFERYGVDLCLGRMVPVEGEPVYIGRLGLTDSGGERLLVDWRSPAAEPFFAATLAQPHGLISRRRYRWTGRRITDYWDEAFTADGFAGDAALDDESAFIASLGTSRSPRMRDVLGTIQADQDAIIRAGSRGALVVDGGPGTGKTVVALHRAAYLLYSDPRLAKHHGGVLFVGPSGPYLSYVSDVLPSLGEDGVQLTTLRALVTEGADAVAEPDDRVAALKSSVAIVGAIEEAVRYHERMPDEDVVVETSWGNLLVTPAEWAEAYAAVEPGNPHNEARDVIWDELVTLLHDSVDEAPPHLLRRAMQQSAELRRVFSRAWPVLDPAGVVADLFTSPAYLRHSAPSLTDDEVALLQRPEPRAWTLPDLPLLDAARQRIGDPEASRTRRRRAAQLEAQREQMSHVIDQLIQSHEMDDGEGSLAMLRQEAMHDALVDDSGVPMLAPDELAGPFAHIVVDEAQELTDAEWQMLLSRCPSKSFTIVGDRAQARQGFPETWQQRLERVGIAGARVAGLTINYRTPEEVMAEAEPVIRAVLPDANVPVSIRSSGIPVRRGELGELERILAEWASGAEDGVACVIGEPAYGGGPRIRSLSPAEAKGLEFDLVVLVGAERWSAVDRYVAMTRATQQLVLLS